MGLFTAVSQLFTTSLSPPVSLSPPCLSANIWRVRDEGGKQEAMMPIDSDMR